jgi:hypothetical protein
MGGKVSNEKKKKKKKKKAIDALLEVMYVVLKVLQLYRAVQISSCVFCMFADHDKE